VNMEHPNNRIDQFTGTLEVGLPATANAMHVKQVRHTAYTLKPVHTPLLRPNTGAHTASVASAI
jgi:hypothetical protein